MTEHLIGTLEKKSVEFADTRGGVIALTVCSFTKPLIQITKKILESGGAKFESFPATGQGGRAMEALIAEGQFDGVLDMTTTELADELVGGVLAAGPERLTAAARKGIPQVIGVGGLDMVNFGPRNTVPERFARRRFHQHHSSVTLMRTTPEENDRLGLEIAQKACASRGPTAIVVPLRGVSALDIEGGPFWWPEANAALIQSLRNWVGGIELIEVDCHINDPEYAEVTAMTLLLLMGHRPV